MAIAVRLLIPCIDAFLQGLTDMENLEREHRVAGEQIAAAPIEPAAKALFHDSLDDIRQMHHALTESGFYIAAGAKAAGLDAMHFVRALGEWSPWQAGGAVRAAAKLLKTDAMFLAARQAPLVNVQPGACPVALTGPDDPAIVYGQPGTLLTAKEYPLVRALIAAWPKPLKKSELEAVDGSAISVLKALARKSVSWQAVLGFPGGKSKGGYRLLA